jgi:ketosteroid isomerase-like protein
MKKLSIIFVAINFIGCLLIGCSNTESPQKNQKEQTVAFNLEEARSIIAEKTKRFTEAHITKDTVYLNNSFAIDAMAFPPNSDIVTGWSAISRLNADWVNYGVYEFTETSIRFYGNAEYLIDEGTYHMRYGDENTIDDGKYINIWKLEDGDWKIFSNIWNTSLPAAQ